MDDSTVAMTLALPVLTAIIEKRNPDARDVEELRKYAPHPHSLAADELAREVIQRAVKPHA